MSCMLPFLIINYSVLCSGSVTEPCVSRSGATAWGCNTNLCSSNTEIYITDRHSWCWPFSGGLGNCDEPHALSAGRCEVCPFCILFQSLPRIVCFILVPRLHSLPWRTPHFSRVSSCYTLALWVLGCLVLCGLFCWGLFCGFFFFLSDTSFLFLARILHHESGGK